MNIEQMPVGWAERRLIVQTRVAKCGLGGQDGLVWPLGLLCIPRIARIAVAGRNGHVSERLRHSHIQAVASCLSVVAVVKVAVSNELAYRRKKTSESRLLHAFSLCCAVHRRGSPRSAIAFVACCPSLILR